MKSILKRQMHFSGNISKPTIAEQNAAKVSYKALVSSLDTLKDENPEIEIEETQEKFRVPVSALQLLANILKEISLGKPVSFAPFTSEVTTQMAAQILGCSRPHVVKLLESGKINFTKIGKHRRIKYDDLMAYKTEMKAEQERLINEMIEHDQKAGLYDSER